MKHSVTKNLSKNGQINFLLKILLIFLCQFISIQGMLSASNLVAILSILMMGLINAHSIQIIHQCCHFNGFKNRKLNDCVGTILSSIVFVDFTSYRRDHFKHHRNLGTENDVEVFGFHTIEKSSSKYKIAWFMLGFEKYITIIKNLISSNALKRNASIRIIAISFMIFTLMNYLVSPSVGIYWLISLVLITEPTHFFIEIPEHFGCKRISREKYENTRTIVNASFIARWFTNWNNFHVEHHLYQWVLPEHLSSFHDKQQAKKSQLIFDSYFEFYLYFFRNLFAKKDLK